VNDSPLAAPQSVTTAEDTAKAIVLAGSDPEGGALTYAVETQPAHGTLAGTGANLSYTPAANYNGPDSFTFRVTDAQGAASAAAATVSITVVAVNDPPLARLTATPASGPAPLAVLVNASASVDPDGAIASHAWDFGYGATGTGVSTSHTYAAVGSYTVTLTVVDDLGATAVATEAISVLPTDKTSGYYTIAPCRLLDTRGPEDPLGGPALAAGVGRSIPVAGHCGIPDGAIAVFLNATVVLSTASGHLQIFPTGDTSSPASAINYSTGETRANNGLYALGTGSRLDLRCDQAEGTVHAIVDVTGYFVP
jgi:PKD repeat protein